MRRPSSSSACPPECCPLEERLPGNPLVVVGLDGIGSCGGGWRMGKKGQVDTTARGMLTSRGLLRMDHNLTIVSGLAESWSVNSDGTEWTVVLCRRVKWFDGQPLTAEDSRFWYEDLILNKEHTAAVPV